MPVTVLLYLKMITKNLNKNHLYKSHFNTSMLLAFVGNIEVNCCPVVNSLYLLTLRDMSQLLAGILC